MLNPLDPVAAWWLSLSDYAQFAVLWVVLFVSLLGPMWVPALIREYRYRLWCGMTCRGGSALRRCPCQEPLECRMAANRDNRGEQIRWSLARLRQQQPQRPVN